MDYSFMKCLTRWRCISVCSKDWYFNVPTYSKLLFVASATNLLLHVSFPASHRLMLSCLKLSYKLFQILIRGTGVADYYNIILLRLNLAVHIFHCSRGESLVALVGVWIVWKLEPLASGGQSSHKLIPHIICQFLCARGKKLWTRTYSTRDQVPTCPVFTRAKIKSRFGILKNLPSQ